jgi:Tol biopolymer transport system component
MTFTRRALAVTVIAVTSCTTTPSASERPTGNPGSADAQAPTPSASVSTVRELAWPDDAIVFSSAADDDLSAPVRLMAVSANGGLPVSIAVPATPATYVGQATWSLDGSRIAFVVGKARHVKAYAGNGDLYVMRADGTELLQLTSRSVVSSPTWSPDGRQLAFVRDQGRELVVMNADGTDVRVIAHRRGYYQWPAWSPDGRWIAFQSMPHGGGETITTAIYVIRPDGRDLRQLTSASTSEGFPAWSPDASLLAYSAGGRLWVMNADGSNRVPLTGCHLPCVADFAPTWAPHGRSIAFLRQEEGGGAIRLYVLDVQSGKTTPLTPHQRWVSYPRWRP